jgi:hypothetical protein
MILSGKAISGLPDIKLNLSLSGGRRRFLAIFDVEQPQF